LSGDNLTYYIQTKEYVLFVITLITHTMEYYLNVRSLRICGTMHYWSRWCDKLASLYWKALYPHAVKVPIYQTTTVLILIDLAISPRKGTGKTNDVRNFPLFWDCCYFKIASTRSKAILRTLHTLTSPNDVHHSVNLSNTKFIP